MRAMTKKPATPHAPGTAPDTSLHLGADRKEWLRQQGGIQPTIIRLIDEAMRRDAEPSENEYIDYIHGKHVRNGPIQITTSK